MEAAIFPCVSFSHPVTPVGVREYILVSGGGDSYTFGVARAPKLQKCNPSACECNPNMEEDHLLALEGPLSAWQSDFQPKRAFRQPEKALRWSGRPFVSFRGLFVSLKLPYFGLGGPSVVLKVTCVGLKGPHIDLRRARSQRPSFCLQGPPSALR